mmetsp:Transcript_28520/g.74912  ORF Transcript_28520/g.74912 Transcript_28520/m.74912 type:complete len:353 (-) Transcript_28520:58-1116(-)
MALGHANASGTVRPVRHGSTSGVSRWVVYRLAGLVGALPRSNSPKVAFPRAQTRASALRRKIERPPCVVAIAGRKHLSSVRLDRVPRDRRVALNCCHGRPDAVAGEREHHPAVVWQRRKRKQAIKDALIVTVARVTLGRKKRRRGRTYGTRLTAWRQLPQPVSTVLGRRERERLHCRQIDCPEAALRVGLGGRCNTTPAWARTSGRQREVERAVGSGGGGWGRYTKRVHWQCSIACHIDRGLGATRSGEVELGAGRRPHERLGQAVAVSRVGRARRNLHIGFAKLWAQLIRGCAHRDTPATDAFRPSPGRPGESKGACPREVEVGDPTFGAHRSWLGGRQADNCRAADHCPG